MTLIKYYILFSLIEAVALIINLLKVYLVLITSLNTRVVYGFSCDETNLYRCSKFNPYDVCFSTDGIERTQ